jgi:hypothetical protein
MLKFPWVNLSKPGIIQAIALPASYKKIVMKRVERIT